MTPYLSPTAVAQYSTLENLMTSRINKNYVQSALRYCRWKRDYAETIEHFFPITTSELIRYISSFQSRLVDGSIRGSTIHSYRSGLGWVTRYFNFSWVDVYRQELVQFHLKRVLRLQARDLEDYTDDEITLAHLLRIYKSIRLYDYDELAIFTLIFVAFTGLLRLSEACTGITLKHIVKINPNTRVAFHKDDRLADLLECFPPPEGKLNEPNTLR